MRNFGLLLLVALLAGCQSGGRGAPISEGIDHHLHSRSQSTRIKMVILHYTAENNTRSLQILTQGEVSAHYLITAPAPGEPVKTYQLVSENRAAWHAGSSGWQGQTHLNTISLGIELVNPGYYSRRELSSCTEFPPSQIQALEALLRQIVSRYALPADQILGHSDVAPGRKQDPGPCFPWQTLAKAGFGAWPDPQAVILALQGRAPLQPVEPTVLSQLLRRFGYPLPLTPTVEQQQAVFRAFQMHFRPSHITGRADAESVAIAQALVEKYRPAERGERTMEEGSVLTGDKSPVATE